MLRALVQPSLAERATALLCMGQREAARNLFSLALLANPSNKQAHTGLGCLDLQEGNWGEGWKHLEWRHHGQCAHQHWDGEDLRRKSILVCLDASASGVGDVLQFARFVPLLK